jgi:hypothetical protein
VEKRKIPYSCQERKAGSSIVQATLLSYTGNKAHLIMLRTAFAAYIRQRDKMTPSKGQQCQVSKRSTHPQARVESPQKWKPKCKTILNETADFIRATITSVVSVPCFSDAALQLTTFCLLRTAVWNFLSLTGQLCMNSLRM